MPISRRSLLVQALRAGAFAPLLTRPSVSRWLEPARGERALVVVQLSGGNDGLNTVVPRRQDAYFRLRPSLALAPGQLVPFDDAHGLHPELAGLRETIDAGHLAVVHGVGLPTPERSHFRSMEVWHSGDPEHPPGERGWMGAMADELTSRESDDDAGSMVAIHVGDGDLPLALRARATFAPSVVDPAAFRLDPASAPIATQRARLLEIGTAQGDLAYLRRAAHASYAAAERVTELAAQRADVDYPGGDLGRRLHLVARLLEGRFGARLFHVELGGFDTHAHQARLHAGLMRQLGSALAAFQADLATSGIGEHVLTLVFSEFGRRAEENGSKGTDHGAGAPVLLLGPGVRPGSHGRSPDLDHLVDGDVPSTTDLRALYATLRARWMGLSPGFSRGPRDLLECLGA